MFTLVIMQGTEIMDEVEYPSMQTCSWYKALINAHQNSKHEYSAYCKPTVFVKEEE